MERYSHIAGCPHAARDISEAPAASCKKANEMSMAIIAPEMGVEDILCTASGTLMMQNAITVIKSSISLKCAGQRSQCKPLDKSWLQCNWWSRLIIFWSSRVRLMRSMLSNCWISRCSVCKLVAAALTWNLTLEHWVA